MKKIVKLTNCPTSGANEKEKRSDDVPREGYNPKDEQDKLPEKKNKQK